MEVAGPRFRIKDPNGRPYPTLVEVIREKEILDGRRQRGVSAVGGLDSEFMKNEQVHYKGS